MPETASPSRPASPHEARWWDVAPDGRVHCFLCPRHCRLRDGQAGFCSIRANRGGRLRDLAYGAPAAVHVDPIEKKPLYHFLPGSSVLSLGAVGCSLACSFCQNWDLSRSRPETSAHTWLPPDEVVALALRQGCSSIAFTYNEPTIWAEYVLDVCAAARGSGLAMVMVTNGYITPEAFHDVYDRIDAANVDLKALSEDFYRKLARARLEPVLETLRRLAAETRVWVEVTNLVIPSLNDDPDDLRRLSDWVVGHLGPDVPLHFSAFHPDHELRDLPPTPPETLRAARRIARAAGLRHVYEGNVQGEGSHTRCPGCDRTLIRRSWNQVLESRIERGRCPDCGTAIAGRWS
ncbi:MAG TPA: AmmeMemoRadiSam system radical SAM enzyme [Terriglobales bacterium]|nr:AmmeMemoRadiSam system radical SAM enzyme [Terriglobales bacterium]